jgi:NAD(P)-dependent dehydrogenase (short-subunit alcohol dehydrogenase family)
MKRIAVVTGSASGIGRALALRIAQTGADVVVNYRNDESGADQVVASVRELGCRSIKVRADLTEEDAADVLISATLSEFGSCDILVNNVGDFWLGTVADTPASQWRYILDSNLNSVYYLSQRALPGMRERGWGRIVNIGLSPVHLVRGAPNLSAYAIAKTGVLILSRSLAAEEAKYGITVNCVSPGLIDNGHLPPAQLAWMLARVPMGRLGRPEEVAHAVAFLTSDEASYISGANIAVGGAWDWEDRPVGHDQQVSGLFGGQFPE